MRVLVLPADMGGCGYYRLIFAAEHLKSLGHDIHIQYPEKNSGFEVLFHGDEMVDFRLPVDGVDVMVMQRVSHELHRQAIPLLRSKGVAIVVDMDDDLSVIHPQNQAFWAYRDKNRHTPYSYKHAAEVCSAATYVTVSTKSLMKVYVKHGRGQVLDNYIPEWFLNISGVKADHPVFGWAGTLQSHPTDLQVLGDAVKRVVDEGYHFKVVGPGTGVGKQLRLKESPEATGSTTPLEWPVAMSTLDVGLAPLEPSIFNQSKSRLKVLEYNATGMPYIASPRDEYRRYHKESSAGLLVDSPKDWVNAIRELMTNHSRRKELAEAGKGFARTQTIEQNSWRFWDAWSAAHRIQQRMKA